MSKKAIATGLMLVIAGQIAVLASEFLGPVYPLWTGKEIRLKTIPVDPRSLFRGNYARLRYEISTIQGNLLGANQNLRKGQVVYVKLKPDANGLYGFEGASLEKPESGLFIRGRIQAKRMYHRNVRYDVRYGIEAYFVPKKKAAALEKKLRASNIATIMVTRNGKAALKEVGSSDL